MNTTAACHALHLLHPLTRVSLLLVVVLPLLLSSCDEPYRGFDAGFVRDAGITREWCRRRFRDECLERVVDVSIVETLGVDETHLYFTTRRDSVGPNDIRRVSKTTGAVETVTTLPYDPTAWNYVSEMLVDQGILYYASPPGSDESARIGRVPVTGGEAEVLVEGLSTNAHLAIDAGWLYYSDIVEIRRLPLAGGPSEAFIETETRTWWLAAQDDQFYWRFSFRGDAVLSRAATDFSSTETIVRSATLGAVRLSATHMYLSSSTGELTRRLIGGGPEQPAESLATVSTERGPGAGVALSTHHYYIVAGPNLVRIPIEGGAVETVLSVETGFFTMIADADSVYAFFPGEGIYRIPDAP